MNHNSSFNLSGREIHNSSEAGYIALISSIIIAGVLMAVVFTLSFKSFMTRFNILDTEYKKRSFSYAEACADVAILRVIENSSYTGETIPFGSEECIIAVTGGPTGPFTIRAESSVPKAGSRKAVSNIEVTLDSSFSVTDWKEVSNF